MNNSVEIKALCDAFSFVAMVAQSSNAHIELPKHPEVVSRHIEAIRDLCGPEVGEHVLKIVYMHMANCRISEQVQNIRAKW